ncbi:MAG TPA: hypothetical protein VD815_11775 [Candidatus Saccharimonadales bacterium]|nr:hypothetical protein [Candidatus Saccharimonadales bacterium]
MKSISIGISLSIINAIALVVIYSASVLNAETVYSFAGFDTSIEKDHPVNFTTQSPKVLINTTSLSNCLSPFSIYNISPHSMITIDKHLNDHQVLGAEGQFNEICKILNVSDVNSCFKYFTNQSLFPCQYENMEDVALRMDNFAVDGSLFVDTRFNHSYDFRIKDPANSDHFIGVNLDLKQHTQSNISDLNSPRIEIVRMNANGTPNMFVAKNQEIIWEGDIKNYFQSPDDNFQNETYIAIQFNTGRHGSNISAEEIGLGVLFDVSSSSDPYLFEYRDDDGSYTKYNYDSLKRLAGDDFIFHNIDNNDEPIFINNLTNREEVKLKVISSLSDIDNSIRNIKTFIDKGTGIENPYWTLNDISKLRSHEKVADEGNFMKAINQGSGYTIARTDNIDTRLLAFHSFVFSF